MTPLGHASNEPSPDTLYIMTTPNRYRSAGLTSITHDYYTGGRHEMLHEINRRDVTTNLLVWMSSIVERRS